MVALQQRRKEPELMDDPALDAGRHREALRGLARINRWSASSSGILWPVVQDWLRRQDRTRARVLDVATGAGDVPIALWRLARRAGVDLELVGCDRSPVAVAYAQERASQAGAPVRVFALDALAEPLPAGYDVVMCSLFLHHLEDREVVPLLRAMARAAGALVLVNDLARSRRGLALAYAGTRLLSRSPVVHTDGVRSVRAAFTVEEVRALAAQAGWHGAAVTRRWPCRWLLAWERP